MPLKVGVMVDVAVPVLLQKCANGMGLIEAVFQQQHTVRAQARAGLLGDGSVGSHAVRSSLQCDRWFKSEVALS